MAEQADGTAQARALQEAYASAARAVSGTASADEAFERATALVRAADGIVSEAAMLRALMAQRILREEGMSLAQLARRIGMSKSRADQLIRAASREDDGA